MPATSSRAHGSGYDHRMPRVSKVKALPWIVLIEGAVAVREHWLRLTPQERARVTALLKKSGGRPGNLTPREREELRRLGRKLDPAGLGRKLVPLGARHGRSSLRRR